MRRWRTTELELRELAKATVCQSKGVCSACEALGSSKIDPTVRRTTCKMCKMSTELVKVVGTVTVAARAANCEKIDRLGFVAEQTAATVIESDFKTRQLSHMSKQSAFKLQLHIYLTKLKSNKIIDNALRCHPHLKAACD